MKVLYLTSQFPSPNDSGRAFTVQRTRSLCKSGADVLVICTVNKTPPTDTTHDVKRFVKWMTSRRSIIGNSEIEGIPVHYISRYQLPRPIVGWYSEIAHFWQIYRELKIIVEQFKPNLIVSSWLPSGVTACLMSKKFSLPTIVIAEGSDVAKLPYCYPAWPPARSILNRYAAAMVFVSNALRDQALSSGLNGKKLSVIHNGVDPDLFSLKRKGQATDGKKILAVSELLPVKGIEFLIDALPMVSAIYSRPVQLTIIGNGPLRRALLKRVNDLNLERSVEFVDPMPQQNLVRYYQQADVLCVPSLSESFGCVIVEAMACGTPVVASRVGGIVEIVDAMSGILIPPGDPVSLANAIVYALEREWDPDQIRGNVTRRFTWSHTGSAFVDLFHQVVNW